MIDLVDQRCSEINIIVRRCEHIWVQSLNNCFVSSIVSSYNLINSAHFDVNDATESLVTWTDDNNGITNDWFFILTNVTRNGKKAIIIKIKDGLTIKWDASIIMHCSTNKAADENYNVYGTYFGSRKD